jgi:dihydrofolate reductase
MGKIFGGMAASLDGYIASADGDMAWLNSSMVKGEDYGFSDMMSRTGAYIMGANTYREALKYNSGGDTTPTFIVTHDTTLPKAGPNVEFFSGDLEELAEKAKASTDKDVCLYGGANLLKQFINQGLIDEIGISLVPVLLGGGVPYFGALDSMKKLKLVKCKTFGSGIVILTYHLVN